MMSKQRKAIKVESHNVLIVRRLINRQVNLWCNQCNAKVSMVTPERAALLRETTPRFIYRKVENKELHFVETSDGKLFICCRSLTTDI